MIGILGGMGTQAGLDFCNKLAKLNRGKIDQKYPLFILYNKSNVPGRPENIKKYNKVLKSLVSGCLLLQKNNCKFKIDFTINGDSFLTKPNKTIFMAKNIIKKVTRVTPKFSTTGGTSDARFIRKISPCLEFGLVNKTMHKVDECVSLTDLKNLAKIYQNILEDYFR